ncbi:MAG: hypothetical protein JXR13_03035 [Thalassovita sp.]
MKPNFALTLSFEGITLLHQVPDGWHEIGSVAFDNPDLAASLTTLRTKAAELAPDGLSTKLVLPDDQIKYLSVPLDDRDPSFHDSMAKQALIGETPYELADLAVTWHVDGDVLQVAAVARDTLSEAEAFAHEHEFNPVSFVANPSDDDFAIEPFFGGTHAATELFGGPVTPEIEKITIIAPPPVVEEAPEDTPTEVDPEAEPAVEAVVETAPEPETPDAPAPTPVEGTATITPVTPPQLDFLTDIDAPADATAGPDATPPPASVEKETAAPVEDTPAAEADQSDATDPAVDAPLIEPVTVPEIEVVNEAVDYDEAARQAEAELGPAVPLNAQELEIAKAVDTPPAPVEARDPIPPAPKAPAPSVEEPPLTQAAPHAPKRDDVELPPFPAFSTVRARRDADATGGPALNGASRSDAPSSADWMRNKTAAAEEAPAPVRVNDGSAPAIFPVAETADSDPEAAMLAQANSLRPEMPAADSFAAQGEGLFSRHAARESDQSADVAPPKSKRAARKAKAQSERQRLAIFGTPEASATVVGGKPKFLGLILTALLLVFLVAMAALASFNEDGLAGLFQRDDAVVVATSTEPTAQEIADGLAKARAELLGEETAAETPAVEPTPLAALIEAEPNAPIGSDDVSDQIVALATQSEISALPSVLSDIAEPIQQPVAQAAPEPGEAPQALPAVPDQGSAALIDTDLAANDPELQAEPDIPDEALAPPVPMTTEERYAATGIWQQAPVPPLEVETTRLDDLYIASIDHIVPQTDAIALPTLKDTLSDQLPGAQNNPVDPNTLFNLDRRGLVEATPEGAVTPDGILVRLGRPDTLPPRWPERAAPIVAPDGLSEAEREKLSKIRPRARPSDLIEKTERLQLGGRTRSELALLRPKARPERVAIETSPASLQTGIQNGIQQALLQTSNGPLIDLNGNSTPNSANGSTTTLTSLTPRSRPENFGSAVQRARETPSTSARATNTGPSIPSSASVARQATIKNQLNLRKVNLIGVYGQPSSREALVRLKNGSYKKVKIGDRIDGGRIAAIGEGELRYVKSGRSVVLKMPRG